MRKQIFLFYMILVTLVSSVVAFVAYQNASKIYLDEITMSLARDTRLVTYILNSQNWSEDNQINDTSIRELNELAGSGETVHWRMTIINQDGKVLADTLSNSSQMENHAERPEVKGALQNGFGSQTRRSSTTGKDYLYYARYSADMGLIVRLAAPLTAINPIRNTIMLNTLGTILLGIAISAIIARSLSVYLTKPIAKLVATYGQNLLGEARVHKPGDEIGALSETLDQMTSRVESIILELKDRNARVDTLINSMEDGIIAVDRNMHILLINPVARRLFGISEKVEGTGKPLVQVIRSSKLNLMLAEALETGINQRQEDIMYQGGKRVITLSASPIKPMEGGDDTLGALAFIQDITSVRKLEEMRSEFVSNVTHELKTPLTSIRGFVETLKNGAIKDVQVAERFLDIIDIEADRLSRLIGDILELSEIESMKKDSDLSEFPFKPLVEEVSCILGPTADEKKVTIEILVKPDVCLSANRVRIKQLMINLMDNAIKYNKENGKVQVFVQSGKDTLEIHVKDTGIGIPEDHLARVFERFYRVDKGRSREMGGTGLGLSIVKHIASLYDGTVRVESTMEKGSDFVVSLPHK